MRVRGAGGSRKKAPVDSRKLRSRAKQPLPLPRGQGQGRIPKGVLSSAAVGPKKSDPPLKSGSLAGKWPAASTHEHSDITPLPEERPISPVAGEPVSVLLQPPYTSGLGFTVGTSILSKASTYPTYVHLIEKIKPSTPAEKAGMVPGDHLVEIDGVPCCYQDHDTISSMILKTKEIGNPIRIDLSRTTTPTSGLSTSVSDTSIDMAKMYESCGNAKITLPPERKKSQVSLLSFTFAELQQETPDVEEEVAVNEHDDSSGTPTLSTPQTSDGSSPSTVWEKPSLKEESRICTDNTDPLPPHWHFRIGRSGDVFYVNVETGEKSRTHPGRAPLLDSTLMSADSREVRSKPPIPARTVATAVARSALAEKRRSSELSSRKQSENATRDDLGQKSQPPTQAASLETSGTSSQHEATKGRRRNFKENAATTPSSRPQTHSPSKDIQSEQQQKPSSRRVFGKSNETMGTNLLRTVSSEKSASSALVKKFSAEPSPVDEEICSKGARAKFQAASMKVHAGTAATPKCVLCTKMAYPMERIQADGQTYHKSCFRCDECNKMLSLGSYASLEGKFFCKPCFKKLFKLKGNYSEGFGKVQHKMKWINGEEIDVVNAGEGQ